MGGGDEVANELGIIGKLPFFKGGAVKTTMGKGHRQECVGHV